MKLVLMKGENIVKTASVQMPEGLLKDGRIVSVETTGELIRKTMKENKIRCKESGMLWCLQGICFLRKCDDAGNDCGAAGLQPAL